MAIASHLKIIHASVIALNYYEMPTMSEIQP